MTYSKEEIAGLIEAFAGEAVTNGSPESDARARDIAAKKIRLNIIAPAIIRQLLSENEELQAKVAKLESTDYHLQALDLKARISELESAIKQVVCDPEIQGGSPTIKGTRITAHTIANIHRAGEPVESLARLYNITESQVRACIAFAEISLPISELEAQVQEWERVKSLLKDGDHCFLITTPDHRLYWDGSEWETEAKYGPEDRNHFDSLISALESLTEKVCE